MTLVSVVVSAAIAGIVLLGMTSLLKEGFTGSQTLQTRSKFTSTVQTIQQILNNSRYCSAAFLDSETPPQSAHFYPIDYSGNLSPAQRALYQLNSLRIGAASIAQVGGVIDGLKFGTILLSEPDPTQRTRLPNGNVIYVLTLAVIAVGAASVPMRHDFPVFLELDSNYQIRACASSVASSPVATCGPNQAIASINFVDQTVQCVSLSAPAAPSPPPSPITITAAWAGSNSPGYWLFTANLNCPGGRSPISAPSCTHSAIMYATADSPSCSGTSCTVRTTSPGIPTNATPCSNGRPGASGCGDYCTVQCQ